MYVYTYIYYTDEKMETYKSRGKAEWRTIGIFLTFDQGIHGRVKVSQIKIFSLFFYVDNES